YAMPDAQVVTTTPPDAQAPARNSDRHGSVAPAPSTEGPRASRHAPEGVVAQVVREGKNLFAVTGEGRHRVKYVLSKESQGRAKPGATVRIVPLDRRGPFGLPSAKVVAAAREALEFAEVSKAFFRQYGIPLGYPKRALAEANEAPEPVWENHRKRLDLREEYIVTIDPPDAKDHDDALSLERLPGGRWKLGVHIADVSEYVPLDGPLDEEALRRSYTQYLPWTAAPMLPQRLSGDLCSLLEGRDRLAFSCFMEVDADGTLRKFEFVETFIRVSRFHSYQEAQTLKEQGDPFLNMLSEFTDSLLAKRKRDGHLDFQLPEPRVSLDENRAPLDIYPGVRMPSHGWVEECMLLANQACAMHIHRNKIPGVYRVHEQPDIEVVAELWANEELAGRVDAGAEIRKLRETGGYLNPAVQQFYVRLLDPSRGALPPAVQRRILQSMKKAMYDARPLGHFALGWQHYAHFTSPIRRYADLWTHRLMKLHAHGKKIPRVMQNRAIAVAEEISAREIDVVKTERKAMRTATAWIFRKLIGREFVGEINGVEGFGLFVSVSDPYGEGMIPVARIRGDYYEKDPETGHLVGQRTRRRFELGMRVKVRVAKSDPFKGQVDFDLLGLAD
ncbi:MAG TPA: RNB domain-containing ribonuclease, partial [Fibrobacteria bacterium]|nr:RNB domain-containing ribonuclease [Fibrobacteria bacterium]